MNRKTAGKLHVLCNIQESKTAWLEGRGRIVEVQNNSNKFNDNSPTKIIKENIYIEKVIKQYGKKYAQFTTQREKYVLHTIKEVTNQKLYPCVSYIYIYIYKTGYF